MTKPFRCLLPDRGSSRLLLLLLHLIATFPISPREEPAIILQVVIPKTGTTSWKYSMKPYWDVLFGGVSEEEHVRAAQALLALNSSASSSLSSSSSPPPPPTLHGGVPFLAGACENPHHDGMRRCCTSQMLFPCDRKRCAFRSPSHHLAFSEIKDGFLPERGLAHFMTMPVYTRTVMFFTILREPVSRVISEFHQWKDGWCCNWFFSADMMALRPSMNLTAFISHRDCPALNRQAWMLAEFHRAGSPSSPLFDAHPSNFAAFFGNLYGASNYTAKLNRDRDVLLSALRFIQRPNAVVGLTEDLPATLALVLSALPPELRQQFFTEALEPVGRSGHLDTEDGSSSERRVARCWRLRDLKMGAIRASEKSPEAVRVKWSRKATYRPASKEEKALISERGALDRSLYAEGRNVHHIELQKRRLCSSSSSSSGRQRQAETPSETPMQKQRNQ